MARKPALTDRSWPSIPGGPTPLVLGPSEGGLSGSRPVRDRAALPSVSGMDTDDVGTLDEAYERLHRTGPEFEGCVLTVQTHL